MASPARIAIAATILCTGFAAGTWLYRSRVLGPPAGELLARLPQERLRAGIDIKALRLSGILSKLAGQSPEEPDYAQFVKETGFDYKRDLDLVVAAYGREETLAFLTGRFDWGNIEGYAAKHGGGCKDGICRMAASTPGRHISFARIASSVLAFASSTDSEAVTKLTRANGAAAAVTPAYPVWFLIPPSWFEDTSQIPGAAYMFATALSDATEILLAIGAEGARYEARLEAAAKTPEQARQIARELEAATTVLKRGLSREQKAPDPQTLSGILSGGAFRAEGTKITGMWPIEPAFFDAFSGTAP